MKLKNLILALIMGLSFNCFAAEQQQINKAQVLMLSVFLGVAGDTNIKQSYDILVNLISKNPLPAPNILKTAFFGLASIYLIGSESIPQDLDKAEKYAKEAITLGMSDDGKELLEVVQAIKSNNTQKINKLRESGQPQMKIDFFLNNPLKKWQEKHKAAPPVASSAAVASAMPAKAATAALATAVAVPEASAAAAASAPTVARNVTIVKATQFNDVAKKLAKYAPVLAKSKTKKNPKIVNDLKKTAVNIKNNNGQTPLMVNPRLAPVVYSLDKKTAKAFVNAKDKKGKSALQYLIQSRYANNVNLYAALVAGGVKVTANDIKAAQNKLKGKPQLKSVIAVLQRGKKNK